MFWLLPSLVISCTLLNGDQPSKAKPSLTKCYRYNKNACCVSAHDSKISDDYKSMLSDQCQREYDFLENYYCFGCNPSQDLSTDPVNKKITLCKSFAEAVWGGPLLQPTNKFDNCGMNTFWRTNGASTIIPSGEWANAYQFFWEVKPTYFEDYNVVIVNDESDPNCYSKGVVLVISLFILAF